MWSTLRILLMSLQHGGASPTTKEEKNEFKIQLRNGQRDQKEVNYAEAIALGYKVSSPTTVRKNILNIETPWAHAHTTRFQAV